MLYNNIGEILGDTRYYDIPKLVRKMFWRTLVMYELTRNLSGSRFKWDSDNIQMFYDLEYRTSTKSCTIVGERFSGFLSAGISTEHSLAAMSRIYTICISASDNAGLKENDALDSMMNDPDIHSVLDLTEDYLMSFLVQGITKLELYEHLLLNESVLFKRKNIIRGPMVVPMNVIVNDDIYKEIIELFLRESPEINSETFRESVVQYSSFYPEIVTEIAGTKWQNSLI